MRRERDEERWERLISMALLPIGIVFALFWILLFYTLIVQVSHLNCRIHWIGYRPTGLAACPDG